MKTNFKKQCKICGCTDEKPCAGGCNWIDFDLCSKCISQNKKAEKLVGLREEYNKIHNIPKDAQPFDFPCELGFHCPKCKYKLLNQEGNYDERLKWSEYQGFIYCRVCNKDYPSTICMPNPEKATEIYLQCIEDAIFRSVRRKWDLRIQKIK